MKPAPSRLAPVFVPRIWGARTLKPLFETVAGAAPIGEVWLTGDRSVFASGPFAGGALGDLWPAFPPDWTGTGIRNAPRIPLLVKFLFPGDKLSLQVHPGDDYARAHESGPSPAGKTEMWYAVDAREASQIGLGFRPGVTRESFERAIQDDSVESMLQPFSVRAGDAFFVPAGTPHMIGPGMVLCEIQQHSDVTYRVFDFNRRQADGTLRALHIRPALDVLNFGKSRGGGTQPARVQCGPLAKTYLAACPYFATEKWEFAEVVAGATSRERFELMIFIAGHGRLQCGSHSAAYGPAEVWFLPAALGAYSLAPESATMMLRTYVPNLEALMRELASEGVPEAARLQLVHP